MDPLVVAQSVAVVAVMCLALGWDVRARRIPNRLTMAGLALGILLRIPLGAADVGITRIAAARSSEEQRAGGRCHHPLFRSAQRGHPDFSDRARIPWVRSF